MGTSNLSVNTPQTVTTTPETPDPVMTIQPGPYNPYSGMNTGSINAFYGNANNIGMGDIFQPLSLVIPPMTLHRLWLLVSTR